MRLTRCGQNYSISHRRLIKEVKKELKTKSKELQDSIGSVKASVPLTIRKRLGYYGFTITRLKEQTQTTVERFKRFIYKLD